MTATPTQQADDAKAQPAGLLEPFLRPRGIALVGASRNPETITARPARYLLEYGYSGDVVIVNRNAGDRLHGHPVVRNLGEATGQYDVALLMVPAPQLVAALRDCVATGVTHAVSIASGFEGDAGLNARAELVAFLAEHPEFRLVGPNSAGVISTPARAILSFSSVLLQERMTVGRVGLVTQSGAVGNGLHLALLRRGAGIAHWISTGNELDLGALRVAAELLEDPGCAAVGLFLEGMTDAEHLDLLRERIDTTGKPVIALRAGASVLGRRAAFGHTGRVIGDEEIARAALKDAGVRLVETLEELCDALTVLSTLSPREAASAAKVGVVTVSGGTGVIAADAVAQAENLVLAELSPTEAEAIATDTGTAVTVANPYDVPVLGDPEVFHRAVRAMAQHGGCDVVLAIVSTLAHDYDLLSTGPYPDVPPIVFAHLSPEERFTPEQARRLSQHGIPAVPSPQNAVRALADWAGPRTTDHTDHTDEAPSSGSRLGLLRGAQRLGSRIEAWMPPATAVRSADEALSALSKLATPVVLKAEGTAIGHRTELGAVRTGLVTPDDVRTGYAHVERVCRAYGDAIVMQATAAPGVEILVSVVRDPEVGVVALCRPGGVLVELGGGTVILSGKPARWSAQLERGPLGFLLGGYRGAPRADTASLISLAADLSAAVRNDPAIIGLECNPVLVHPVDAQTRGATVVDLVVSVADPPSGEGDRDPMR